MISESGKRKGVSSVIGGIIVLGIIFSVGSGYFYGITQDQQSYQNVARQNSVATLQKSEESLYVVGSAGSGTLTFTVNNTGITAILVSYFVSDQTGKIDLYKNGSPSSASACASFNPTVACALNQGSSTTFSTGLAWSVGTTYTIRVVTGRGTVVIGAYPTKILTTSSVDSVVASGLGSLEMAFNSFSYYNYTQTGGPWKINLAKPLTANIAPYNMPIALSAQITNNDPSAGTIVVDAHTDLWTFVSCSGGCG